MLCTTELEQHDNRLKVLSHDGKLKRAYFTMQKAMARENQLFKAEETAEFFTLTSAALAERDSIYANT